MLSDFIRRTPQEERKQVADWLASSNDVIMKSERFTELIDRCCMQLYKKHSSSISDDNLSFIRRSANELLRNKASKDALRKRLLSSDYSCEGRPDDVITPSVYPVQVSLSFLG